MPQRLFSQHNVIILKLFLPDVFWLYGSTLLSDSDD